MKKIIFAASLLLTDVAMAQDSIGGGGAPVSTPTTSAPPAAAPAPAPAPSQPAPQLMNQPSFQPNPQPMNQPSFQPNPQPMNQPSFQPNTQPMAQPSFQPSPMNSGAGANPQTFWNDEMNPGAAQRPAASGSLFGAGATPANPAPQENLMKSMDAQIMSGIQTSTDQMTNNLNNQIQNNNRDLSNTLDNQEYNDGRRAMVNDLNRMADEHNAPIIARQEAAAQAAQQEQADRLAQNLQAQEERRQFEYENPEREQALEQCIGGMANGACVATESAREQTRTLIGDDATNLLDYRHNRSWADTNIAGMSDNIEKLGKTADKTAGFVNLGHDIKTKGFGKAMTGKAYSTGRKEATKQIFDNESDAKATLHVQRAQTELKIDGDGNPVYQTTVPEIDRGAAVKKLGAEALEDANTIKSSLKKGTVVPVVVSAGKYAKWMSKSPEAAANRVMEQQNERAIKRTNVLNQAMEEVVTDPQWTHRTTLPPAIKQASQGLHTSYTREEGAALEIMYWQSWAAARDARQRYGME